MIFGFLALMIVSFFFTSCAASKIECCDCEKLFIVMDDKHLSSEVKINQVKKHLIDFHYECWKNYERKKY